MRNLLCLLLISFALMSCQSQKITSNNEESPNYFVGTWYFTEKKYKDNNETKQYPLHECMRMYRLIFEESNGNTLLTKEYSSGEKCSVKSNSGKIPIAINQSSFSYFEDDLKKNEKFRIYSENKFSIRYNDIINGNVTEIEDVYEKK